MPQNFVMNNHQSVLAIIEHHLDTRHQEYQSYNDTIEIYSLDKGILVIKIDKNNIMLFDNNKKYEFPKLSSNFFSVLDNLID